MTLAMTMTYLNRRRTVKHLTREMRLGNFDGIVPSLACILEQHGICSGKYPLKTLEMAFPKL